MCGRVPLPLLMKLVLQGFFTKEENKILLSKIAEYFQVRFTERRRMCQMRTGADCKVASTLVEKAINGLYSTESVLTITHDHSNMEGKPFALFLFPFVRNKDGLMRKAGPSCDPRQWEARATPESTGAT